MPIRTTAEAVEAIIPVNSGDTLVPFIEAASALIDDACAPILNDAGLPAYNATRLELIERWLSAHFYAVYDGQIASEKADEVSANYQYDVGKYLTFTKYGQQAIMLDTLGGLLALQSAADKGRTVARGITHLGCTRRNGCDT